MKEQGPPLEELLDRLLSIPDEFINTKDYSDNFRKEVSVPALLNDMLLDNGGSALSDEEISKTFPDNIEKQPGKKLKLTAIISILCYLFEDNFFTGTKSHAELIKSFILSDELLELSKAIDKPADFITDPERREEICRRALDALNYYPYGESEENSSDRLLTLDSVERKKILTKTGEAQKRAKQIHEAMMRKEAEEAASKMSRE